MPTTLIVEDGTGLVAGANAYVDVAFVDNYCLLRGKTGWSGTTAAKEAAIISATDYVDSFIYRSTIIEAAQPLQFPRQAWSGLPVQVQKATAEYAVLALAGSLYPDTTNGARLLQESVQLGDIRESKQYALTSSSRKIFPEADRLLYSFIVTSNRVLL